SITVSCIAAYTPQIHELVADTNGSPIANHIRNTRGIVSAKHLQYTLFGLFVLLVALTFSRSNTHGDTRVVALNGQPAPGFVGGRFGGFSSASVNTSGDMAFCAAVNVGGVQSAGIFAILGGILTPIALEGQ